MGTWRGAKFPLSIAIVPKGDSNPHGFTLPPRNPFFIPKNGVVCTRFAGCTDSPEEASLPHGRDERKKEFHFCFALPCVSSVFTADSHASSVCFHVVKSVITVR